MSSGSRNQAARPSNNQPSRGPVKKDWFSSLVLAPQADWQKVTNMVNLIGNQNAIFAASSVTNAYYRLVSPDPTRYVTLANGVIAANLSHTLTTDWTLSINVLLLPGEYAARLGKQPEEHKVSEA